MWSIAIVQIYVWLACSTYYVMAAPMQGIAEVTSKAGCPCGHDAEKMQPLVKNSPPTVVVEERNVIESGCKGDHDHDHHHGPVISNSQTPPPSNENLPTGGSCASGCGHHDGPVVIPGEPTPPISKEMPSAQSAHESGCGHDHGPVILNKPTPPILKEMPSSKGSCGGGCDHHHGPTPVIADKPSSPPALKEKPTTSTSSKSGYQDHDHIGASDTSSHGKSSGGQSKNVSEAPKAGGCCQGHHHGH